MHFKTVQAIFTSKPLDWFLIDSFLKKTIDILSFSDFTKVCSAENLTKRSSVLQLCLAQWVRLLHKYIQNWFVIILAMFVKSSSEIFYQSEIILQTDIISPT